MAKEVVDAPLKKTHDVRSCISLGQNLVREMVGQQEQWPIVSVLFDPRIDATLAIQISVSSSQVMKKTLKKTCYVSLPTGNW
jgi:hypothetical protein